MTINKIDTDIGPGQARPVDTVVPAGFQTFAGTDISVIFDIPIDSPSLNVGDAFKMTNELQTITISSSTSILPVRATGNAKPLAYGKGARTFAGSMIFTVQGDPFQSLYAVDALNNSVAVDKHWFIDQMPPFDAIIIAENEFGGVGVQIIHGMVIANWGTTYSVDDVYTESTYTYMAEHVTPFIFSPLDTLSLYGVVDAMIRNRGNKGDKTPDDVATAVNDWYSNNQPGSNRVSAINSNSTFDWWIKSPGAQSTVNGMENLLANSQYKGQMVISNLFGINTYANGPIQEYVEGSDTLLYKNL